MTPISSKKISRRDALKLLGAAIGAATLSTLPSKWSKPELTAGVLPAHAQTSPVSFSCPIVRQATVGTINAGNFFFNFNAPISDAEITACNVTQVTYSWTSGQVSSGPIGVMLAQSLGVFANNVLIFNGHSSPRSSSDSAMWTGNRPYNGIQFLSIASSWVVDTMTVTLS